MIKRLLCTLLGAGLFCHASAYAEIIDGVKYVKTGDEYDYSAVYTASSQGEIIPISLVSEGYGYAYMPEDGEFEIIKAEAPTFIDVSSSDYYINEMSARGVLNGFDDGTFRPYETLTRAQMAAVFSRLFRITSSDSDTVFSDIPNGSWYSGNVAALTELGVFKEDGKFNPEQEVTREQLTAMAYRMLSGIGTLDHEYGSELSRFIDHSDISEYAEEAYGSLTANGYNVIHDWEENDLADTADDEYILSPRQGVTRQECAEFLYDILRNIILDNAPAIKRDDAPEIDIPVLDGSTSTYSITNNIYWNYYINYENHPDFPKEHSKTSNSYKRLIDGEVELIFVPDPSEDIKRYAEERGVTLKYIPIANEALVFFTANKNSADNITTEQLRNIYVNNGIDNWKEIGGDDSGLVPFCRNNDSGSHAQMERFILAGEEISDEIEREHTSLLMASILTDVDRFNSENPGKYAIGYSLYYYYLNVQSVIGPCDLKLMSIDGTEPTDETIANGIYPYTTNYYAVIRDEGDPKAEAFAELMQSEFGDKIISASGMGVTR